MSASFAGSKHLDERRRRRLAADAEDPAPAASAGALLVPSRVHSISDTAGRPQFPLRKLISHAAWKHWLLGVCALAAGGLLLWAGARMAAASFRGDQVLRLFDLAEGRLLPFYQSALLAIAGQLALLIGWTRSRSQEDFQGRFRMWTWCALGCFTLVFAVSTGAHLAFGETVAALWRLRHPQASLIAWLAPSCVAGLIVYRGLRPELVDNTAALALVRMAGFCWLAAAAERLGWIAAGAAQIPQAEQLAWIALHPLLPHGLLVAAPALLFTAMLLHARHVIHVTAEPPAPRKTLFQRMLGALVPRRSKPAVIDSSASGDAADSGGAKSPSAADAARPMIRAARSTQRTGDSPSESGNAASPPRRSLLSRLFGRQSSAADSAADQSASRTDNAARRSTSAPGGRIGANDPPAASYQPDLEHSADDDDPFESDDSAVDEFDSRRNRRSKRTRIDRPPPDPQSLKGLTKRERKLVRKQWREQQRAARGDDGE